MDAIFEILQYLTSSESIILSILILIFLVYKKLIEPKLKKLELLELEESAAIKKILTIEDLQLHGTQTHDTINELSTKFETLSDQNTKDIKSYFQDCVQINKEISKEVFEQLMEETKKNLDLYKDLVIKLEKQISEYDEKVIKVDNNLLDIIKMANLIYEILDCGFSELEKKGVIDEFDRVSYKNFTDINHLELNKFVGLMSQMINKQKPSNSRLNRILE